MATTEKNLYVTKTGMLVDTSHTFFNIPRVDKLFSTLAAKSYRSLVDALTDGNVGAQATLMLFSIGDSTISIPITEMAYHHAARGRYGNVDWAAAFCPCCNMVRAVDP